jgi:hypothetical protein
VLLVYGLAIYARQISSVHGVLEWYSAAGHGLSQTGRLTRMATGLPRSFLYLGKDGILYKRFLKHDPYAIVTLRDLAGSFWKLAAYYLFAGCFAYEMLRRPRAGWLLALIAAGTLPVIFFAVFVFEPSSAGRYLPFLPFIALGTAWVLRDLQTKRRVTQLAIAAFLILVVLTNGYSFFAPRVSGHNATAHSRVSGLRSRLNGAGLAMVATNRDELEETQSRLVFDNINRPAPLPVYDIIEPGNSRTLMWRQELAARTLKAWAAGGEVWVSRRMGSPLPEPSWNWVEGDDPRVSWKDVPRFFATLNTDTESGGTDGFLRLATNQSNLGVLTPLAGGAPLPAKN